MAAAPAAAVPVPAGIGFKRARSEAGADYSARAVEDTRRARVERAVFAPLRLDPIAERSVTPLGLFFNYSPHEVVKRCDDYTVYKFTDEKCPGAPLLKFAKISALHDDDAKENLIKEANVIAAIARSGIPHALPAPCVIDAGDRVAVISPSFGEDLYDHLARGSLTYKAKIDVIKQVLEYLKAMHESGDVHGDIKSGNLTYSNV
jgi:hypothetical protein